ncbi:type VI secretion system-associated protein TagF [Pseudomonas sp. HN11]|uniref:type VI secretion system-associated protein TagF n=1 Tax=Pseudomonas sp. HN11 TaxID=1344094 RepID=UPI001F411351|nr:type VI secretion system-associated protein TagF [Pseudomonas sp. HN11]UII69348.1 type VI secretion system-associated protein TagF [Pseudomonas sp. HN11]
MNGFFGKVPSLGDFVSRRLPLAFLNPWDAWLQVGLQCSRERWGEQWLEVYLCSPIWHFALAAGVCGEEGWAGVMIPSVDRVGRYFPLTVAAARGEVLLLDAAWHSEVERLALSALGEALSLEVFDDSVQALPMPAPNECMEPGLRVLFWTDGSPRVAPTRWEGEGLPDAETFADMLGGP